MKGSLISTTSQTFKEQFFEFNLASGFKRKVFAFRVILITFLTGFSISNALTAWAITPDSISCIWDGIFEATTPINTFFLENKEARDALLIFSSFLVDVLLLWFAIRYALWGNTTRQLIFFVMFYCTRAAVQSFFLLRIPEGYCWDYPGFPSLTVSYQKTSDFFYSGHVGVMLFCSLENKYLGNIYMMWVALGVCLLECTVMIFLRGHYSIDLISGLVFAHYFWIVSAWIAKSLDRRLGLEKLNSV